MKVIIVFGLLLITSGSSMAQSLDFKGGQIDSIVVDSYLGSGFFNSNGESLLTRNRTRIIYDSVNNTYKYDLFDKIKITHFESQKPPEIKIIGDSKYLNKNVRMNDLDSLIISFTQQIPARESYDNLKVLFKKKIKKSIVLQVAESYNSKWHFSMEFTTRANNKTFYRECASQDSFQVYLNSRYDNKNHIFVTDYANGFGISIHTTDSTYRFEGTYPHPFKQPWFASNQSFEKESIENFNINKYLTLLLPKEFLLRDSISFDALIEDYIEWYLRRRRIIN